MMTMNCAAGDAVSFVLRMWLMTTFLPETQHARCSSRTACCCHSGGSGHCTIVRPVQETILPMSFCHTSRTHKLVCGVTLALIRCGLPGTAGWLVRAQKDRAI